MPIEVVCWNCGKKFGKKPANVRVSSRNFCSSECKQEYFRDWGHLIYSDEKQRRYA